MAARGLVGAAASAQVLPRLPAAPGPAELCFPPTVPCPSICLSICPHSQLAVGSRQLEEVTGAAQAAEAVVPRSPEPGLPRPRAQLELWGLGLVCVHKRVSWCHL